MKKSMMFTTINGAEIKATYEYTASVYVPTLNADGWEFSASEKEIREFENMTFEINGEIIEHVGMSHVISGYTDEEIIAACESAGVKEYWRRLEKVFVFSQSEIDKLNAMISEVRESGSSGEVKEMRAAKAEAERQELLSRAEKIIASADNTFKNKDGSLMTEDQAKIFRHNWNGLHNEGGEGYVPDVTTAESVAWARNILEEYK